jgi:FkbM family methyltransferase
MPKLNDILIALTSISAWRGVVAWPVFSVTSFAMLKGLARQGIVPRTVLDVGANIGQFSIVAANLFPKATVYAFEPHPAAIKTLTKNCARYKNARPFPVALGEQAGERALNINSYSHASSFLSLGEAHQESFPHAYRVGSVTVPVTTLDEALHDQYLRGPVLLKVDVQGYEPQVLRGGTNTLNNVDYVILEASFKPMYQGELLFGDIVRLMESYGFMFLRPVGSLSHPKTGEILQVDALFSRRTTEAIR